MSTMSLDMSSDVFAQMRELPADLQKDLPILLVNRKGSTDSAYMRTENIVGYVEPGKLYRLTWQGLRPESDQQGDSTPLVKAAAPDHAVVRGDWISEVDLAMEDSNILGGMGSFLLPDGEDTLTIPVAEATPEALAFYDSHLLNVGETIRFDAKANLPVTITAVGEHYAEAYLMDEQKGGGTYLEVHDRPHFHMPLHKDAGGYLIIGKRCQDGLDRISAFKIPYGCAVAMAPWCIHSDAYLVGRYMVIYSATPEFSTVILREKSGQLAKIEFSKKY